MENNVYTTISQQLVYLNPALRKIGEYILDNLEECKTITTKSLASVCGVAESTVTRFVREIGITSFQQLKIGIAEYLMKNQMMNPDDSETNLYEDISASDSLADVIDKLVYRNTLALTETQSTLNREAVRRAAELINDSGNIIIACQGFSSIAAKEAVLRFARVGKTAVCYEDESTTLMLTAACKKGDLVIGISNTGRTAKVVQALEQAKKNGGSTIGITSFEDSPLVEYSDVLLVTPTKMKAAEAGTTWESASSKTAQILVIDIICAWYSLSNFNSTLGLMDATYKSLIGTRRPRNGSKNKD